MKNYTTDGFIIAQQALQSLRNEQTCGMSLKRAVAIGAVTIVYSDEKDPRKRTAKVVLTPRGERWYAAGFGQIEARS